MLFEDSEEYKIIKSHDENAALEILNLCSTNGNILSDKTIELIHKLKMDYIFFNFEINLQESKNPEIQKIHNLISKMFTYTPSCKDYFERLHNFLNIMNNNFEKINIFLLINSHTITINNTYGYTNVSDFYHCHSISNCNYLQKTVNNTEFLIKIEYYNILGHACFYDNIDVIIWCLKHYKNWINDCDKTNIDILIKIIFEKDNNKILNCFYTYRQIIEQFAYLFETDYILKIFIDACIYNKLNIVKWIYDKYKYSCNKYGCEYFNDNINVNTQNDLLLDWFQTIIPHISVNIESIIYACKNGYINILDWLLKHKFYCSFYSDIVIKETCISLQFKVLEWLNTNFNKKPIITDDIIKTIIQNNKYPCRWEPSNTDNTLPKKTFEFFKWCVENNNLLLTLSKEFKDNLFNDAINYNLSELAQYLRTLQFNEELNTESIQKCTCWINIQNYMWLLDSDKHKTNNELLMCVFSAAMAVQNYGETRKKILEWFDKNQTCVLNFTESYFVKLFNSIRLRFGPTETISFLNLLKKYVLNFNELFMKKTHLYYYVRPSTGIILDWFKNNTDWNCKFEDEYVMDNDKYIIEILDWFSKNSNSPIIFNEFLTGYCCINGNLEFIKWFNKNPKHLLKYNFDTIIIGTKYDKTEILDWFHENSPTHIKFDFNVLIDCIKFNKINTYNWYIKHLSTYPFDKNSVKNISIIVDYEKSDVFNRCIGNPDTEWMLSTVSCEIINKCEHPVLH